MAVRAIIIDDFATDRQYIRYYLVKFGCAVVGEAANAHDGLKLFRALKPEIVTIDLVMPKVENVDPMMAIRAIKEAATGAAIVVLSTIGSQLDVAEYWDAGILEYVVKPISQFSFDRLEKSLSRRYPELRRSRPSTSRI